MDFDQFQKECAKTDVGTSVQDVLKPGWLYYALGVAGESGELMEKIKKHFRDDGGVPTTEFIEAVEKEMGDVLWYMARLGDAFGLSLNQVALANVAKLQSRMDRGKIHGDGDNR